MRTRSRPALVGLLLAIIAALAFASAASASTLSLTSDPSANMAPQTTGGWLVSMQKCDTTPPSAPPVPWSSTGCGLYAMTDTSAASVRGLFASPSTYGNVTVSAYVSGGSSRTGTIMFYLNGSQVGSAQTVSAGASAQWYTFPAVQIGPSDVPQIVTRFDPGSKLWVESLHAEFTPNTLGSLIHSDMTQPYEQLPEGVPCYYDWSGCDGTHKGATVDRVAPTVSGADVAHGYHWLAPWGQAYDAKTGNPAPADRVEVRGLQEYLLSGSTNAWSSLYTDDTAHPFYANNPAVPSLYAPTATASSSMSSCQSPHSAIDGIVDYPQDACGEWASYHEGAGAWLRLTWQQPVEIHAVTLYDRPNLNDQVTGGTLNFSDGSTVPVGALNNDGSATTVSFPSRWTTSLEFDVASVSSTTTNVGLSEIQPIGQVEPKIGGGLFPESFVGPSACAGLDYTGDPGSVMSTPNVDCNGNPVSGDLYHFFPAQGRIYVGNVADIAAIASVVQMRLAPTNPAGPPNPDLIGNMGADVWNCAYSCSQDDGMGESQFKTIGANWRTFVFDTAPSTAPLPPITVNGQPIAPDALH